MKKEEIFENLSSELKKYETKTFNDFKITSLSIHENNYTFCFNFKCITKDENNDGEIITQEDIGFDDLCFDCNYVMTLENTINPEWKVQFLKSFKNRLYIIMEEYNS